MGNHSCRMTSSSSICPMETLDVSDFDWLCLAEVQDRSLMSRGEHNFHRSSLHPTTSNSIRKHHFVVWFQKTVIWKDITKSCGNTNRRHSQDHEHKRQFMEHSQDYYCYRAHVSLHCCNKNSLLGYWRTKYQLRFNSMSSKASLHSFHFRRRDAKMTLVRVRKEQLTTRRSQSITMICSIVVKLQNTRELE